MYVFSFAFWGLALALALIHQLVGARTQQRLLLVASLVVYASFDPWLLVPLAAVVLVSWIGVRTPYYTDDLAMLAFARRVTFVLAFVPLIVLRYVDPVLGTGTAALTSVGVADLAWSLDLLVPVGLAFYTLQATDSIVAVHRGAPAPRFFQHVLHVSFFPTVFIGPVQRHEWLHEQLSRRRRIQRRDVDAAAVLILCGVVQKLVVADNLLPIGDRLFENPSQVSGADVPVGLVAFGLGLFAELGGYTAVVTGLARLFGIRLGPNIDRPYAARSPIDFWSRWLLSVNDWMLRHVFGELGGTTRGSARTVFALAVTFLVGALWYGPRLGLVVWAALHFLAVVVQIVGRRRRRPSDAPVRVGINTIVTFLFVSYAWVWFGAQSLGDALRLHRSALTPELSRFAIGGFFTIWLFGQLLVLVDAAQRGLLRDDAAPWGPWARAPVRGIAVAAMILAILVFNTGDLHDSLLATP